jgi:hypothetical protein
MNRISLARRYAAGLIAAISLAASLSPAWAEKTVRLFNGRDLTGWEGNPSYWSVQDGVIVGKLNGTKVSTYLVTKKRYRDFRLLVTVKQVVKNAHSGIAYWGFVDPENDWTYHGHLAMFPTPWGIWDLYGRSGIVDGSKTPAPQVGKEADWNTLEILALAAGCAWPLTGRSASTSPTPSRGAWSAARSACSSIPAARRRFTSEISSSAPIRKTGC